MFEFTCNTVRNMFQKNVHCLYLDHCFCPHHITTLPYKDKFNTGTWLKSFEGINTIKCRTFYYFILTKKIENFTVMRNFAAFLTNTTKDEDGDQNFNCYFWIWSNVATNFVKIKSILIEFCVFFTWISLSSIIKSTWYT